MTALSTPGLRLGSFVATYGLVLVGILLWVGFALALPDTFPTVLTARSILDAQAIIALLALGELIVVATGEYDLSVGFMVGLLHILTLGFIVKEGMPWGLAVALVLAIGLLVGLLNGILVHFCRIDSFIATLGTGTIAYAVANWYTKDQQIFGTLPGAFTSLHDAHPLGVPAQAWYVFALTLVVWVVLEYTPTGRYIYALGANRRAAELTGIRSRRYVLIAFMASGVIVAIAGVVLAARLQIGTVSTGPDYLLPVFVGAMLGSTTIRPGRPNALGTIAAVSVLGIGIAGFQQLGGTYYVIPLFNGTTLIIGVGLAVYAGRRARRVRPVVHSAERRSNTPGPPSNAVKPSDEARPADTRSKTRS